MVSIATIQELSNHIAQTFDPEKIILFGSHASGKAGPDSDVDLLVVIPHRGKSWQMAARIRGAIDVNYPLDLLVRSPEEMQRRLASGDPFMQEIEKSGELLYES